MRRPASRPLWMLLAAVALLGAGALAELRRDRLIQPHPLTGLKLTKVHKISVECPDCTPRRFERIQGQWGMVAPYTLPADAGFVERLLAVAHAPTRRRYRNVEIEPAQSGLAAPVATLSLDDRVLTFGSTDPMTGDRYVGYGNEIALLSDRYLPLLQASPETALDKHPISPGTRILAIELDGQALAATALPAWRNALATVVRPAGAAAAGRHVEVRRDGAVSVDFQYFEIGGEMILRREIPALDYVLDAAQAKALDLSADSAPP